MAFQLDLPKYESLDTQVLGVSVDVLGARQAFAEKLGLTYPLLSDFSRDTVKTYGVMVDDPNSAYFRMARRAYFVIDTQGMVRYKHVMQDAGQMLDPEELFDTVKKIVTGAWGSAGGAQNVCSDDCAIDPDCVIPMHCTGRASFGWCNGRCQRGSSSPIQGAGISSAREDAWLRWLKSHGMLRSSSRRHA